MGNANYKIGDWLICDLAEKPLALQYTHISKHGGYGVNNQIDQHFSLDTKGLRSTYLYC